MTQKYLSHINGNNHMVELFYNKEERRQLLDIFLNSEYAFPTKAAL